MATKVTQKGQVTIPKPIRDHLGIGPGSKVEFKRALRYTIKGGVVYDTEQLLADVRELVKGSWEGDPDGPPHRR